MTRIPILFGKEMAALFYSAVAYILMAVYFLITGLILYFLLSANGFELKESFRDFFEGSLLFWVIVILAPSLLTMRLFAEERKMGTLETLLTAPAGDGEIVLAKYFAALAFYFLLWLPVPFAFLILRAFGGTLPVGPFLTGWLGILMVGALFTSLGLFTSTVTSNQIIAAVLSILGSLFLLFFPLLSFLFPWKFLQHISRKVDFLFHFHNFSRGVVETGALVYYLSLTVFFLFLSVRSIEARRWKI